MTSTTYHGIFAIPCTPFHDDLRFDDEGLTRVVDFAIHCGAHGLVWPVLASEFYTLSDAERIRGYRIVVEAAQGRAPVVAGVAGTSAPHAIELANAAAAAGVQALIALPPYTSQLDPEGVMRYYRALGDATGLPIFVQNAGAPLGSPVSPSFLARMAREIPQVDYVKEEVPPALHRLTEVIDQNEPAIQGVFGGAGGIHLIEELRRGASGNMPACHLTDVLATIYERYRDGDEEGARTLHRHFLPVASLEQQYRTRLAKEVLVRRGIIRRSTTRVSLPQLDAHDRHELDRALAEVANLMRV